MTLTSSEKTYFSHFLTLSQSGVPNVVKYVDATAALWEDFNKKIQDFKKN